MSETFLVDERCNMILRDVMIDPRFGWPFVEVTRVTRIFVHGTQLAATADFLGAKVCVKL